MNKKIAIIEDDTAVAEMYELKLTHLGYKVAIAQDGEEGLELVRSFEPDLILLDLMLPGMRGEALLKYMRSTDWGASVRVIILTNVSKDEAPTKLRFLSVDRYIVKAHHTPSQVADIIREVLNENAQYI